MTDMDSKFKRLLRMEAEWTWKSNCFFYIAAVIIGLGALVIGREDKALWHIGQLYMLGVAAFLLLLRGEDMFHGAENQICGKFGYAMLPASKWDKALSQIIVNMLIPTTVISLIFVAETLICSAIFPEVSKRADLTMMLTTLVSTGAIIYMTSAFAGINRRWISYPVMLLIMVGDVMLSILGYDLYFAAVSIVLCLALLPAFVWKVNHCEV